MRAPLVWLNAIIYRAMESMWRDSSKAKHRTFKAASWLLMLHAMAPQLLHHWYTGRKPGDLVGEEGLLGVGLLGVVLAPLLNYLLVYWRRDAVEEFYALYRRPCVPAVMPFGLLYIIISSFGLTLLLLCP